MNKNFININTINKLTDIGLEVESVETQSSESDSFLIAKILKLVELIFNIFDQIKLVIKTIEHELIKESEKENVFS